MALYVCDPLYDLTPSVDSAIWTNPMTQFCASALLTLNRRRGVETAIVDTSALACPGFRMLSFRMGHNTVTLFDGRIYPFAKSKRILQVRSFSFKQHRNEYNPFGFTSMVSCTPVKRYSLLTEYPFRILSHSPFSQGSSASHGYGQGIPTFIHVWGGRPENSLYQLIFCLWCNLP